MTWAMIANRRYARSSCLVIEFEFSTELVDLSVVRFSGGILPRNGGASTSSGYWYARDPLLETVVIIRARGRGGAVRRAHPDESTVAAASAAAELIGEAALAYLHETCDAITVTAVYEALELDEPAPQRSIRPFVRASCAQGQPDVLEPLEVGVTRNSGNLSDRVCQM